MAELSFDVTIDIDGRGRHILRAAGRAKENEVVGLIGPSGSGKTTLLRALAGLNSQAKGHIGLGDTVWQSRRKFIPADRRDVGVVFQDMRLFPHMSVAENLQIARKWKKHADLTVPDEIIEALELGPLLNRAPERLSGGEARRVALGRALASDPKLILMDEPMTGLDQEQKRRVLTFVARAVSVAKCPVIYVSHDRAEIERIAPELYEIQSEGPNSTSDSDQRRYKLSDRRAAGVQFAARVMHQDRRELRLKIGGADVMVPAWLAPEPGLVGRGFIVQANAEHMFFAPRGTITPTGTLRLPVAEIAANAATVTLRDGQILSLPSGLFSNVAQVPGPSDGLGLYFRPAGLFELSE